MRKSSGKMGPNDEESADNLELAALSRPVWADWSTAQSTLTADDPLQRIKSELEAGRPAAPHYELVHGILFYKGRFVVPSNSSWIPKLLAEFHVTPSGGHAGAYRTYRRLASNVYWPGMVKHFRPHRQATIFLAPNRKLAPRFFGPFRVGARIGKTAYRLELPAGSRIHPVFHVSLLKRAIGSEVPDHNLPDSLWEADPPVLPDQVLDRRSVSRDGEPHDQVLVQWLGQEVDDATWVDVAVTI
ncbi:hypothetical protein SASPL_117748 [Salvia splendens]|uniref:Integrase zinc-binding domain-containing protein n=1 Tax=Salvia splendens TaxID=180675 RepID=A0A8X8ZY24_SALSN|nr:hypothetical protein SASPL_117748 [Salvia splendens]